MDKTFTQRLNDWLDTPDDKKDFEAGCVMLLQLSNKPILVNNIRRNPSNGLPHLIHHLKKYLEFRLASVTRMEVADMQSTVATIPTDRKIVGKREDHDSLPPYIQGLYVENASILQNIRRLQTELSLLEEKIANGANITCPDSERYPFLKEIISLDKKYHQNWEVYDHYSESTGEELMEKARKDASTRALRFVNLNKGKYAKNPTPELKERLADEYAKIIAPTDAMTDYLREIGVL